MSRSASPSGRQPGPHGASRAGARSVRARAQWVRLRKDLAAVADAAQAPPEAVDAFFGGEAFALAEIGRAARRELAAEAQYRLLRDRALFAPAPAPLDVASEGPAAAAAAAAALRTEGVAFLAKVVDAGTCDRLSASIDACTEEGIAALGRGVKRIDWFLGLEDSAVRAALEHAVGPGGVAAVLGRVPEATEDARLVELSVLSTEPGAPRQTLHPDQVGGAGHAPLFTAFVALQDVEPEMGPTVFLPGSMGWSDLAMGGGAEAEEALLRSGLAVEACLRKGDAVLYDARTLHAGGANRLRRRRLLTFTFLKPPVPEIPERHNADSACFSIKDEVLAAGLTARDLARAARAKARPV